jgi:molybdopterin/thiamine biosynthesis adenylyltransferase
LATLKERRADINWWALWPALLDDELAAYARFGITPRIAHKRNGILILEVDWPIQGWPEPLLLRVSYSPLHPFYRAAVTAPNKKFERHQNPVSRELCLLVQETKQWDSKQPVADLISKQLDQLMRALSAREESRWDDAAKLEEQAADPLMPYFSEFAEDDSVILFDGRSMLPHDRHGLMEIVVKSRPSSTNPAAFEGVLRQLKTSNGAVIGKRFGLPNEPKDAQTVIGRWVRFTPHPTADAEEMLRFAEEELARQAVLQPNSVQRINETAQIPFSVTGIVFPEESEYRSPKNGTGWLFLAKRHTLENGRSVAVETKLILGERAGKDDIFSRLPVAKSLLPKKAVVIGCGAIGSFVGLELARAGVGEVAFVDFDRVQPGNSLRWPLGRSAWGRNKANALAAFVTENYPWTKAMVGQIRLGATVINAEGIPHDSDHPLGPLFDQLKAADVVIDTSASSEVQLAISQYCRLFRVPYVMGYATLGVAGGLVARFLANSEGCFVCLNEHWSDKQHIPEPRVDDAGIVTPVGCNAPTFTGGGFDLQEISLEVVRTAVGLLSDGSYDPGDWEVAVLTLRDDRGARRLPHWEGYSCPPHSRCCGRKL